MNTAQKNIYSKRHVPVSNGNFPLGGFESFRRRIIGLLSANGECPEIDDEVLFPYYRNGESETYVVAAFGYEC